MTKKKSRTGRIGHIPTDQTRGQVEAMAGYGITAPDIGAVLGISDTTLRKHYRDELDLGTTKANAKVAQNLFKRATSNEREAVTAAIFWLKTRAQWKETAVIENNTTITTVRRTIVDSAVDGTQPEFDIATGERQEISGIVNGKHG